MDRQPIAGRMAKYLIGDLSSSEPQVEGYLTRVVGMAMEAVGLNVPLGCRCEIAIGQAGFIEAEVVGFADERVYLMPIDHVEGLSPGAMVLSLGGRARRVPTRRKGLRSRPGPSIVPWAGGLSPGGGVWVPGDCHR